MSDQAKRVEFFAFENSGPDEADFAELVGKLRSDDDTRRYHEAYNGAAFIPAERGSGYTVTEVLPELTGVPFNNLALAYLHALRPSSIRVSHGTVCCDARVWRVTVYLSSVNLIERIVQEVEVGYGCGADVDAALRAAKEGREPRPRGSCFGHTSGLERADFS